MDMMMAFGDEQKQMVIDFTSCATVPLLDLSQDNKVTHGQ